MNPISAILNLKANLIITIKYSKVFAALNGDVSKDV